jgi:hypothetical protein
MSDPSTPKPKPPTTTGQPRPAQVDPETGTDPDGTPTENPSG